MALVEPGDVLSVEERPSWVPLEDRNIRTLYGGGICFEKQQSPCRGRPQGVASSRSVDSQRGRPEPLGRPRRPCVDILDTPVPLAEAPQSNPYGASVSGYQCA